MSERRRIAIHSEREGGGERGLRDGDALRNFDLIGKKDPLAADLADRER